MQGEPGILCFKYSVRWLLLQGDEFGAGDTTKFSINSVSTNEVKNLNSVYLYPNPPLIY
jgi:hypothetical protein